MKTISVVIPCKNEEKNISVVYQSLKEVASKLDAYNFEYIFVDDGSVGNTLNEMKKIALEDKAVKYISFSRNFGKEAAMLAGFKVSTGDYVTTIDSDLQDPPELIIDMVKILEEGEYDNVATIRKGRKGEGFIRSMMTHSFYRLSNQITEVKFVSGARDFRLMKREMVEAILSLPEAERFLKGIYDWVGFKTYWLEFDHVARKYGSSNWNIAELFKYALNGMLNYTSFPLNVTNFFGWLVTLVGLGLIIAAIIISVVNEVAFLNLMSILGFICILFGILFFCIGFLGKYLYLTLNEVRHRPHYIIRESNIETIDRIG